MKRRAPTVASRSEMLQLRATLNYIEPPIWRRLVVPVSATFAGLHGVLQTAFGWTNSHLHRFSRGRAEMRDNMAIGEAFTKKNDAVLYEYDFGASWETRLVLEAELPAGDVTGGEGLGRAPAGPLAHRGGVACYENLIEALA